MKQTTADKTAAIATLQTKLDDSGNHIASFDPTKSETQLMRITSGAIAGAAVAIPPAALSIPVSIAVGEGVSLATSSFSQTLGITDNKINAGGPSVSFSASQDVVATNPMTLSIPFGSTSLNLNDADSDNIVVMYRWTIIENGETKFEAGILPGDSVTRARNKVSFQTKKFGTFQVGLAEKKITTAVAAKTEEPPALKSCERYAAEVFPNCSTHGQIGCVATNAFRAVDMTLLKAEFILSGASIQNVQGNVVLPAASQVRAGTPFGAGGNQFTGTFSLSSDSPALKACERYAAAVYQPCIKDAQVGCVTTDAFKAADMTLIRPEIILAGRIIGGVAGTVVLPSPDKVIVGRTYGPTTASVTGTSFAAIPTLSYSGATGTRIKMGQTFSVSPTPLLINGSDIIACGTKVGTPSLPAGLAVNQSTCAITGAPTALLSPTTYTIVATNAVGASSEADITLAVLDTAATPIFSPNGGTYGPSQTVSITSSTPGAMIYYTTDGSTPTVSSNPYVAAITVTATQTIRAVATHGNFYDSNVGSASFTINGPVATPTFSVSSGSYNGTQTVAITSATPGASIYFTTNGTTPSPSSPLYTGPVTISSTQTLGAIATKSGFSNSSPAYADYVIDTTPPSITLGNITTPSPGTTRTPNVSFTSNEAGTFWLSSKAGCLTDFISSSSILIASNNSATTFSLASNATTEIYVKAKDSLGNQSCTLVGSYTHDNIEPMLPVIADASRTFNAPFNTSISQGVPADANFKEFRYTTSGMDPTCSTGSFSATQPTSVAIPAANTTLKVITCDKAGSASNVASEIYTYNNSNPTVSITSSPASGSTNNSAITLTFTFSQAVTGFTTSDILLTNATAGTFTVISSTVYTLAITATGAFVSASVPANSANDSAGGGNLTSSIWSINYDAMPPNAPLVSGPTQTSNTNPTWTWTSGGNAGNGTYRYKLNNADFSTGSTTTTTTSFTPTSALSTSSHTLYVQERDAAGNWSAFGSFVISIVANYSPTPPLPAQPTISSISPDSGSANGGTIVTITGQGFALGATITLAGNVITGWTLTTSGSASYITFTTPFSSAIGRQYVQVRNPDGQSAVSSGFNYLLPVDILVVGGGGGGGFGRGGGGGGGGVLNMPNRVIPYTHHVVQIGEGGGGSSSNVSSGSNGANSIFSTFNAEGGGGGGSFSMTNSDAYNGSNGASGGGASSNFIYNGNVVRPTGGSGVNGQGNFGGNANQGSDVNIRNTGGGGGADGEGITGNSTTTSPNGGDGLEVGIMGLSKFYGGGGGGASGKNVGDNYQSAGFGYGGIGGGGRGGNHFSTDTKGHDGAPNSGGGGGGGVDSGGNGGSGVVILVYPIHFAEMFVDDSLEWSLDTTTRPGFRVYTFISGSGNIYWANPDFPAP